MSELPIVCTLSPEALSARRQGLLSELLQQSEGRELTPDGLRLRFAPSGETLSSIAKVEPDAGQFTLDLNGPQGTGEFVAALLDM
jgi:hypothetical protein